MEAAIKKLKKHWTFIWLLSAVIAATAFVTYGAYTGIKTVKRVATTQASSGELFSSNCMMPYLNGEENNKKINTRQYTVTVCNFEQNNPMVYNQLDVTYTLTAEIKVLYDGQYRTMSELAATLGGTETTAYQAFATKIANRTYSIVKTEDDENGVLSNTPIVFNGGNAYRVTFSGERLKKSVQSTDKFLVTFDTKEFDDKNPDYYIDVKAEPNLDLNTLECLIYAVKSSADMATWTGALLESDSLTYDYDFYNYIISGSGAGTIDIMWEPEWFDINPFFVTTNQSVSTSASVISDATDAHYGWKKITLTVDSTQKNRYEIQLYKVQGNTSYTGDHAASNYIAYHFTASEE